MCVYGPSLFLSRWPHTPTRPSRFVKSDRRHPSCQKTGRTDGRENVEGARIEWNTEFCLGWLFNMSRDFLSLSPSPICSHVPAGGLLEEKFISRMIKLACMPIFTPLLCLPSSSRLPPLPSFSCTLTHPILRFPPFSPPSAPALPLPPTSPSSCCAMSLSLCHINFIPKKGGGVKISPDAP